MKPSAERTEHAERTLQSRTRLLHGNWRVTERVSFNKKDPEKNRVLVEIWYDDVCVFDSHGHVALSSAIENVRRWIRMGHIPQIPTGKTLADYPTQAARDKATRKNASGVVAKA